MKKRITLLITAALLAVVGVQATTSTMKKFIMLSFADDATNGITWNLNDNTVSGNTITFSATNSKKPYWTFESPINLKDFIVTATARNTSITFELIDNNDKVAYYHWWGDGAGTLSGLSLANDANADITAIKRINIDCRDNEKTNLSATLTVMKLSVAVEVSDGDNDFLELKIEDAIPLGYGNSTCADGVITFGGDNKYYNPYGWEYVGTKDWSSYQYMVIVPRKVHPGSGNRVMYTIYDNANWAFNPQLSYGQSYRATVFDIKNGKIYGNGPLFDNREEITPTVDGDKWDGSSFFYNLDYTKISKFEFRTWNDGQATFEAAVFLTNTEPNYRNYTNNHWEEKASNYKRDFTAEGYATVCLPYNWAPCGADVYDVVGVDDKDTPSKLYLEKVNGVLKAGKAYIIQTNGCASNEDYKGVTFYKAGAETAEAATDGALKGTLSDNTVVPENSYILKDGKWKKSNGSAKVNANRAYLTLTPDLVVPTSAPGMIVMDMEGNDVTGIETVHGEGFTVNGSDIFDLSGRRVSQPTKKGIYVKNGKKYIVK